MLNKIIEFFRGGSSTFNDAEMMLLLFVAEALPEQERSVFSTQINSVSKVKRYHPGRLVVAYYPKSKNVNQLPYVGYEHCLANVTYRSKSKAKTTSITLHEGRLMTLERNVPRAQSEIESIIKVVLHPKGYKSVAEEINAEEHG
jgi:hypothetical protein